ncbi:type IV prepilin leader peptidase [Dehalococcoides mccartyi GY50]|nr:type IV prepilin leader peptidase [Dehalococcoides mccartyi GY50]
MVNSYIVTPLYRDYNTPYAHLYISSPVLSYINHLTVRQKKATIYFMFIGWVIFFFLLGAVLGSFINMLSDRLPAEKSIVTPGSVCDTCGKRLGVPDLIPILSFIFLKGHCRYCGAKIPARALWVEIATACLFSLFWVILGPGVALAISLVYLCVFITLFVIDLEKGLILNVIIYPFMVLALLLSPFYLTGDSLLANLSSSFFGGLTGLGLFLLIYIASRGGMGEGDIKMAGFIGLVCGFPNIFVAIFAGIVLGGLAAAALMLSGKRRKGQTIPFGPFLAVGAVTAMLFGSQIMDWYLSLA